MDRRNCFSLDIWMTLIRSDPRYRPARDEIAYRMADVPTIPLQSFRDTLRWADKASDVLAEMHGVDHNMRSRFELAASMLGVEFSIDYDELLGECDKLLKTYHPMPMHPLAPRKVTELAERHSTIYASNTGMLPSSRLRSILHNLGYPDLHGVFSDEVGASKPSAAFFSHVVDHFGDDAVIMHVGDNPVADGVGARSSGLWYVKIDDERSVVDVAEAALA